MGGLRFGDSVHKTESDIHFCQTRLFKRFKKNTNGNMPHPCFTYAQNETVSCILNFSSPYTACGISFGMISD